MGKRLRDLANAAAVTFAAPLRTFAVVALLCALSACASSYRVHGPVPSAAQLREYAAPGPPDDPWGAYIKTASKRFGVPEAWIREVMQQESGGQQYVDGTLVTSPAGAMGLMQVMPQTYAELRQRYALGRDPYDPQDNIFAGAAYLRELYDRYGSPGFLAAYNAGPQRLDSSLAGASRLPAETRAYVAAVAPRLGLSAAPSPLARYARTGSGPSADDLNRQSLAGMPLPVSSPRAHGQPAALASLVADPSADDLNKRVLMEAGAGAPGAAVRAPQNQAAGLRSAGPEPSAEDLNRGVLAAIAPSPGRSAGTLAPAPRAGPVVALSSGISQELGSPGGWGVQVGAFSNASLASTVAADARALAGGPLGDARMVMGTVTRPDGGVLYRARLVGISASAARAACDVLARQHLACEVVSPARLLYQVQ